MFRVGGVGGFGFGLEGLVSEYVALNGRGRRYEIQTLRQFSNPKP